MKRLISRHKDAVLKHTNLDYDRIQQITYLYEFDREVQYVAFFHIPYKSQTSREEPYSSYQQNSNMGLPH